MDTVSVRDLRNDGGEVLNRVARGESLTVTRDGEPVATVAPLPRKPLSADQLLVRWSGLPRLNREEMRNEIDEIMDPRL